MVVYFNAMLMLSSALLVLISALLVLMSALLTLISALLVSVCTVTQIGNIFFRVTCTHFYICQRQILGISARS